MTWGLSYAADVQSRRAEGGTSSVRRIGSRSVAGDAGGRWCSLSEGVLPNLSAAGRHRRALSTHAFNVASFLKKHQKAQPVLLSYFSFMGCFFLQIINSAP